MTPRVSVVLPTCRREGLGLTLRALDAQTFRDFEIILADEVRGRAMRNPHPGKVLILRVHVPPSPHYAFCRVLNAGIAEARGELVAFLYDWSAPAPDWIERHLRYHQMGRSLSAGPYSYHPIQKPPDEVTDADFDAVPPRPDPRLTATYVRLGDIFGGNLMVPRESLLAVGGADEVLDDLPFHGFQDTDLLYRLFNTRLPAIWDPGLLVRRVEHPTSTMKPPIRLYEPEEEAEFYGKRLYEIVRTGRTRAERGLQVEAIA